eukprot:Awhi_evm1s10491
MFLAITVAKPALKATLIATAVLVGKFFLTTGIQGKKRILAGSRPQEDVKLFPKAGAQ